MSELAVRVALETQLASLLPPLDTVFENTGYTPREGVPYQRVHLLPNDPANLCMGAAFHRLQGVFQVLLCYPAQQGAGVAARRAQMIRDAFACGASFQAQGVTVRIARTASISAALPDADRYCVPVRIRYFADVLNA